GLHKPLQLVRRGVHAALRGAAPHPGRLLRDAPRPVQPLPPAGPHVLFWRRVSGVRAAHPGAVRGV
ncbi:MAG: hypothetical protein AVDCRST_MAG05-3699, partial [uncultured Rubrobacteraceae bacterium]